jgi:hypothetical protein
VKQMNMIMHIQELSRKEKKTIDSMSKIIDNDKEAHISIARHSMLAIQLNRFDEQKKRE